MPSVQLNVLPSLILLLLFININTPFSNKTTNTKDCTLEANIKNWQVNRDYELLDSMVNRDTFWHDDSLRFGYYINAIGILKIDSSMLNLPLKVDTIRLYGDDFGNKGIEANFRKQYRDYMYKLIDDYQLKSENFDKNCSFIIHQRKFRACT